MIFRRVIMMFLILSIFSISNGQNVGIGTSLPDPSAKLDISSSNSGFLPPRMSSIERNLIQNPATGLMIYCTDCGISGEWQGFNGLQWMNLSGSPASSPLDPNVPSVQIGTQNWSKKNLDVTRYRNGDLIPQVTDSIQWVNLNTGAWCWYNNDSATYAEKYGRLYNWYAVNDPRGLAPQNWHVPTDEEWNRLIKFIDPTADTAQCCCNNAARAMTAESTCVTDGIIRNTSGFFGMFGGQRLSTNAFGRSFSSGGVNGYFWTSSSFSNTHARCRQLNQVDYYLPRTESRKLSGLSVRVIRD